MSSTSSQESAASPSDSKEPDSKLSPSVRSNPTAEQLSLDIGQEYQSSRMSKRWATPNTLDAMPPKSTQALEREATIARPGRSRPANLRDQVSNESTWNELTSSAEVSHVKTSRSPAKVLESRGQDQDSGVSSPVLLAKYDPNTSSWRTSQLCLEGGFQEFWETLPKSGMTRNGTLYQLRTLELRTSEKESGLWPTPQSNDHRKPCWTGSDRAKDMLPTAVGGQLNPTWVEGLMGFPFGWTDLTDGE